MSIERISKMIRGLKSVEKNFEPLVIEEVKPWEAEIVEMNTEDQLYDRGVGGSGKPVVPAYRPFTIEVKRIKGQVVDRVTLRDTGDFHEAYSLFFQDVRFAIVNDDPKARDLEEKYTGDIFGLTDDNLQEVRELICDPFLEMIRNKIFDE